MRTIVALTTCICVLAGASGVSGQTLTPTAPPPLTPSAPPLTPSAPPLAPSAPSAPPAIPSAPPLTPTAPPPVAPSAPPAIPSAPPLTPTAPPPVAPSAPPAPPPVAPSAPPAPPPVAPSAPPAPANTPGAVTTLSTFNVGNWSAAAFTAPGSMDFDHCAGETLYRSGITLGFKVTGAFLWSMYFYNPAWKLTPGASYPLAFTLDYSAPDMATAIAIGVNAVEVALAPDMTLFKRFMEAEKLKVEAASESFVFDLTDTSQLLPDLLNCVHSYVGAAPATSNPFQSFTGH